MKTPQTFGAIGDGVTDDTAAFQALVDDLAQNGGYGFIPSARYRLTQRIYRDGNDLPFTLEWEAGAKLEFDFSVDYNGWYMVGLGDCTFVNPWMDFGYHNSSTDFGGHGFCLVNCDDCEVRGTLTVKNWKNTGVYIVSLGEPEHENIHIERAVAISDDEVANNGTFLGRMLRSGIEWQHVRGVRGSPGYAVQMKETSQECYFTAGVVEDSKTAIAMGQENETGATRGGIGLFHVRNCWQLFSAGYAEDNDIGPLFYHYGSTATGDILDSIGLDACDRNRITATIVLPTAPDEYAARLIDSDHNRIDVTLDGPRGFTFEGTSTGNRGIVRSAGTTLLSTPITEVGTSGNTVAVVARKTDALTFTQSADANFTLPSTARRLLVRQIGTLTAHRNYTLPQMAEVGDEVLIRRPSSSTFNLVNSIKSIAGQSWAMFTCRAAPNTWDLTAQGGL